MTTIPVILNVVEKILMGGCVTFDLQGGYYLVNDMAKAIVYEYGDFM